MSENKRDIVVIVGYLVTVLLCLVMCSCKTTYDRTREESFTGTHYEATDVHQDEVDLRYKVLVEWKGGNRHIIVYDTDKAVKTKDGFVSPVLMDITENDSTKTVIEEKDSIKNITEIHKEENDSIQNDIRTETHAKNSVSGFKIGIISLLIGLVVLIGIIKK